MLSGSQLPLHQLRGTTSTDVNNIVRSFFKGLYPCYTLFIIIGHALFNWFLMNYNCRPSHIAIILNGKFSKYTGNIQKLFYSHSDEDLKQICNFLHLMSFYLQSRQNFAPRKCKFCSFENQNSALKKKNSALRKCIFLHSALKETAQNSVATTFKLICAQKQLLRDSK